MTGRKLCSPAEGELTRRRERASMVREHVAETYPEHGIALWQGILADAPADASWRPLVEDAIRAVQSPPKPQAATGS